MISAPPRSTQHEHEVYFGSLGRAPVTITIRYTTTYYKIEVYDVKQETELSDSLHNYHCQTEARKNLPEKTPWGKISAGNLGRSHGSNSK